MTDNSQDSFSRILLLSDDTTVIGPVEEVWPQAERFHRNLDDTGGLPDQISRERVQLVISSLSDGDGNESQTLKHIRRVHPNLPMIAILPKPDLELTLFAFRGGVNDVLVAPVTADDLQQSAERLDSWEKNNRLQGFIQQSAKRSLDDLILLKVVGETVSSAENLQALLDPVVELIQSSLDVEIVSLLLTDDDGVLNIRSSCGLPEDVLKTVNIAPGEGVSGHVLETGEPVLIDDLSTDGRFLPRGGVKRYRTGSLLSVPIQHQSRTLGVLNVNNKRNGEAFSGVDQELLLMIAHQTALAIENLKLVGSLRRKKMEVERAHEELVVLHQDRTRFVCNLSHELKTPLTSVLGFADLLHNYYDQVEEPMLREYIERLYTEGKHLEKLLTGMLRLFSLDSGSENWQWQCLSIENTIGQVLLEFEEQIEGHNIDVRMEMARDLKPVRGDQDKLTMLFHALVDNAIKFNRKAGRISIDAGNLILHGESMVCVRITNQGQTVPIDDAERVFQGYTQLGDLDVAKPSGIGLGLATSRAILRQMKGEIFIEPNSEQQEGTTVSLLMPTEMNNG